MGRWVRALAKRERGATAVEYVILLGLIGVAALAVIASLGGSVAALFGDVRNRLSPGAQFESGAPQDSSPPAGDPDPQATATVSLSVAGDGGSFDIPLLVQLSQALPTAAGVQLKTQDGSAVAPTDYAAIDTAVSFPAGTTQQTVVLHAVNRDLWTGATRQLTATLSQPSGGATISGGAVPVVLPGSGSPPHVGFADASAVTLPETDPATPVTVHIAFTQVMPVDGIAQLAWVLDGNASADDLQPLPGSINVPAGSDGFDMTVSAAPDTDLETDETAHLQLVSMQAGGQTLPLDTDTRAVTIPANGMAPQVYLAALPQSPIEEGTSTGFSVRSTARSYLPVQATVTLSPGTASAADYSLQGANGAASRTVTIPAGETEAPVGVDIVADNAYEDVESFGVALSAPVNATLPNPPDDGMPVSGTISIARNGPPPGIDLQPASGLAIAEGGATGTLTLAMSNPSWNPTNIRLVYTGNNGLARSAFTLAPASGESGVSVATISEGWMVTVAPGPGVAHLVLAAVDDSTYQGPRSFSIALGGDVGLSSGANTSVAVSLADNDPKDFYDSCADILATGFSHGSGTYTIRVNGTDTNVYCDMNRDGVGGWTLVRHVAAGGTWWPLNDDWSCGGTVGTPTAQPGSGSAPSFGMNFCGMNATELLLTTGDGAKWIRVSLSNVQGPYSGAGCGVVVHLIDSHSGSHDVGACMRAGTAEDPWLSDQDHGYNGTSAGADNDGHSMLWGENSYASTAWSVWKNTRGGIDAYVR